MTAPLLLTTVHPRWQAWVLPAAAGAWAADRIHYLAGEIRAWLLQAHAATMGDLSTDRGHPGQVTALNGPDLTAQVTGSCDLRTDRGHLLSPDRGDRAVM